MAVGDDKGKDKPDPVDDVDDNDDVDDDDNDDDDDDEFSDKSFNAKRARQTILEQRKSERELSKQLKETRRELKELKARADSQGGDGKNDRPADEKLAREKQESDAKAIRLESELRKATIKSTSSEVASKLGFRNPAKAYRLLDMDDVDFDDDGKPVNLKTLLREELRDNPELRRRRDDDDDDDDDTDADGGRGRRRKGRGGETMNDHIRAAAGR